MKKYLLGAALFLSAATAFAAPPSEESLERLMQVQHVDKVLDEMFAKVPALTIDMVQKQGMLDRVPADKRQAVKAATERYLENMAADIRSPAFTGRFKALFAAEAAKTYTQEEVDALIAFYSTPVGQSVLAKQPQFFERFTPSLTRLTNEVTEKHQQSFFNEVRCIAEGKTQCGTPPAAAKSKRKTGH